MDHELINAVHSHLTEAARTDEGFVYYSEIIRMAHIGHLPEGALEGALGNILGEVNEYDWQQDPERPMLSSVAVSKVTGSPSYGYFKFARELGRLSSTKENDELTFWINELKLLRSYWQARSETEFLGIPVTYNAVREVLADFDATYPNPSDYNQWTEKDGYKYAIEFGGRFYPPKHILSVVTGIDVSRFSGGDQTNRVFKQLGLDVVDKPGIVFSPEREPHKTYLLTWNPRKFEWEDFQDDWDAFSTGSRPRFQWSCGNTKSIEIGDRVFLIRLGYLENFRGIVASGIVTAPPFEAEHWSDDDSNTTAMYVEFEPDALLDPATNKLLDPQLVSQNFNWHPQRSGVTIPSEIAARLELVWEQHVQRTESIASPEETSAVKPATYPEGSQKPVSGLRYERNPRARKECINHHGSQCVICGFDFGEVFGAIGEGFIHVHHLIPISERNAEYTVDPIEDLRPVCPNCHAMLHRKSPPYSIEELQYIRQQTTK